MTPFTQFIKDKTPKEDLVGVEVGVFDAINATYILQDLPIKKLYLVDNYKPYWDGPNKVTPVTYDQFYMDGCYSRAINRMDVFFGKTMFIIRDSSWAAQQILDDSLDFVYIDAGHTYDEVMEDMNVWWPKTKSGGVFGGHDYGTVNGAEVKRAVDDFMKTKEITASPSIGMRRGEAMEWALIKP